MDDQQQFSVPVEVLAQALTEQRNTALDQAAQMKALALHFKAELDQANAELEKLRADA
jgi:hypothetical protein